MDIGLVMPHVEAPPGSKGKDHVAAVGRGAWQGGTLVERVGVEDESWLAKSLRSRVETACVDVVVYVFVTGDEFVLACGVGLVGEVCRTVVECTSVGRPCGEYLELVGK